MGNGPDRWARLIRGETRGPLDRALLAGLGALSVAYRGALHLHLAGYRTGLARRTRLPALVVSIGNLTLGGTGKTTASIAVARRLAETCRRVALLSRGYRGAGEGGSLIVSEGFGPLVEAGAAGDEPYLMARALPGVAVVVGKDRRRTGRLAVERLGANALVLDDGFQYQRLRKDVEIALVDALAPFGYDFLVPRGLLREPPEHLARADAVWITHSDLVRDADLEAVRERVRALAPAARLWEARHVPVRIRRLGWDDELEPAVLRGARVVALSSIGNPVAFERTLEQMGAVLVGRARFPDHHTYRVHELQHLPGVEASGSPWVVTTEKDAVRLPPEAAEAPIWTLEVELAERAGRPQLAEELDWLLDARARK